MPSQTRFSIMVDDVTRESLRGTIEVLMREETEKLRDEMRNAVVLDDGVAVVRNQGENQRQNKQYSRVTKIEFPKFGGVDVKGWLYECKNVAWLIYKEAILQRFGNSFDDPLINLKHLYRVQSDETMRVVGMVGKFELHNLIDSDSSRSFFNVNMAKKLGSNIKSTCSLQVTVVVVDGKTLTSDTVFAYKGKYMTLRGATKLVVQWMNGRQAPKAVKQITNMVMRVYPPAMLHMIFVSDSAQSMDGSGLIYSFHSQSSFSSLMVMVKKDESWRICIDYMHLNRQIVKDKFHIPIIEELIDELHRLVIFSKMELSITKLGCMSGPDGEHSGMHATINKMCVMAWARLGRLGERHKVDIARFQETKWKVSSTKERNGYKLWYSGSQTARNGVGVILKVCLKDKVVHVNRCSDRIISLTLVTEGETVNVISAYAPQVGLSEEEKKTF
ncbi:cleavage/polyadenylation specificity factor, 25kDa subunit [Tanacetum coccineum]